MTVLAGRRQTARRSPSPAGPAEPAPAAPPPPTNRHVLRGISEIRSFFRKNKTPIYFVSPTAFNLLGIDRWVRNFRYVNYYDSFDGTHPNIFVPDERGAATFESIEEIGNYLLGHKEVADLVDARAAGGKAVFLMFDEETEALAARARPGGRASRAPRCATGSTPRS